jgi:hypothetical protein
MGEREGWQDADDAFNAAMDEAPAERPAADAAPWPAAVRAMGEWYDELWYAVDEDLNDLAHRLGNVSLADLQSWYDEP